MIQLSIVIVNWNVKEFLRKCLFSIYNNVKDIGFEVIVVDNNSSDGSAEMVRNEFPKVSLIANNKNLGFAKGNNLAIKQAKGKYILILNPDTEIIESSIEKILSFMDVNKDVGILAPKLIYPNGRTQESIVPPFSLISYLTNVYFPWAPWAFRMYKVNSIKEVYNPTAACLLVRKDVFEKIGLFDEDFFVSWEDVDFCHRVRKAGIKMIFFPEAEFIHYKSQCAKKDKDKCIVYKCEGLIHLVKKYYGRFGIYLLILNSLLELFLSNFIFPIFHILFDKPKDVGYFKKQTKIMWQSAIKFLK